MQALHSCCPFQRVTTFHFFIDFGFRCQYFALTTSGGPGDDTMSLPIILVKGIMDYRYGYANAVGVVMFIIGLIVLGVVNKLFRMDEANY